MMKKLRASARTTHGGRIIDSILGAEALFRYASVTDTPRLDAEVLLADTLGVSRSALMASQTDRMGAEQHTEYVSRTVRRLTGEPVAYITGKKEFMGFTFHVDRRALIPRPETETLVEFVVETLSASKRGSASIVDIGTGCGCIAISLALLLPDATVHATDISEDAISLARLNVERHGVSERVILCVGDMHSALPATLRGAVDAIVSNPPYISHIEYSTIEKGIREFEPAIALKGGTDGLDPFRQIAAAAHGYLRPGGLLAVEIGESQGETALEILRGAGNLEKTRVIRDLAGRQRVITGRRKE
ncbi:MAG: peptide chain release factor N(5)-glutamine methyltransferase [Candidatus Lindowbacteria bacterium]|nr:peptide chain release factor N(5)-glutamine methyltransferase [Candidatus Lindowbacteria bacterium]